MDIAALANNRRVSSPVVAAPESGGRTSAPDVPVLNAMAHVAWFDLNGDGKIDNVSTMLGGDAYLDATGGTTDITPISVDRIAVPTPSSETWVHALPAHSREAAPAHAARPATPVQMARARAAYTS